MLTKLTHTDIGRYFEIDVYCISPKDESGRFYGGSVAYEWNYHERCHLTQINTISPMTRVTFLKGFSIPVSKDRLFSVPKLNHHFTWMNTSENFKCVQLTWELNVLLLKCYVGILQRIVQMSWEMLRFSHTNKHGHNDSPNSHKVSVLMNLCRIQFSQGT